MKSLQRVAFIGNYLPRRCGIATFTHDLHRAVAAAQPNLETCVVAMTDSDRTYDYPSAVRFEVHDETIGDYVRAAAFLNNARFDVVSLQHEYGIFGGEAGGNIIELLSRLQMPVVTTLHTVLAEPTRSQRDVMGQIIDRSAKVVVMAEKARELLLSVHDVAPRKIEVIPHGIPDFPFLETHHAKAKFDFAGKMIILTFGLLSPNKGVEIMLDAMPEIIKSCPNALYVILGATHPNLMRQQGEAYRDSLTARVRCLGIENHVVFFNQFVDQATLLDFISMCDVYTTPYLNEAQMTSGTLAYSFGLGKAVVSTPYWHAKELLSDGRGILVPFGDAKALGAEIAGLLTNDARRDSMRKLAYAASRSMTWVQTAKHYLTVLDTESSNTGPGIVPPIDAAGSMRNGLVIPDIRIGHFLALCDSTGILQHAVHSVPDRSHGYCADDNSRALLLSSMLANFGETQLSGSVTARFAAFVQHAWNPDTRRFRNFMSYDRRWLEQQGSEDSHGRTLWALAECARTDVDPSRRKWAEALFKMALPVVEDFSSPRAWAFSLLALDAYCKLVGGDVLGSRLRGLLADRMMSLISATETKDWVWFENMLAYDNARLPQSLIQTGLTTHTPRYVEVGLRSLRWLTALQTTSSGYFRPVGTKSFNRCRQRPEAFDQQPVEAAATISACLAAWRADDGAEWPTEAFRAFEWFLGENDLQVALIDPETGGCSDGLHPDRANGNKGAESVLSYLLGLVEIRQLKRMTAVGQSRPASKLTGGNITHTILTQTVPGSIFVPTPIRESPELISTPRSSESRRQTLQTGN
ncbi:MAG TPA: glycosyltransferase family 4 protein [Xanthobacteraceae bacterium]|jgi:glycosyltransferase involved in cell wall biosynthesis